VGVPIRVSRSTLCRSCAISSSDSKDSLALILEVVPSVAGAGSGFAVVDRTAVARRAMRHLFRGLAGYYRQNPQLQLWLEQENISKYFPF
jgi:hypothetical protein